MPDTEMLEKAIVQHTAWKIRLRRVIDEGKCDTPVAQIAVDNQCDFGKWLKGLPPAEAQSAQCKAVRERHAEFHKAAANLVTAATSGRKADAEKSLTFGGEFAKASSKLVLAVTAWKDGQAVGSA